MNWMIIYLFFAVWFSGLLGVSCGVGYSMTESYKKGFSSTVGVILSVLSFLLGLIWPISVVILIVLALRSNKK